MTCKIISDNQGLSRGVSFLCTRSGRLTVRSANFAELIFCLEIREEMTCIYCLWYLNAVSLGVERILHSFFVGNPKSRL